MEDIDNIVQRYRKSGARREGKLWVAHRMPLRYTPIINGCDFEPCLLGKCGSGCV